MRLLRAVLGSRRGRIVLAAIGVYLAFQLWLTLAAPGKIAPGFAPQAQRVNVLVTLPFVPERFHVLAFQRYGRVSGTEGHSVEVRGVRRADLAALAKP